MLEEEKRTRYFQTIKASLCVLVPSTLLLFSSFVFAARPLTTDDAWTVEKGQFQIEAGFETARQDNRDREVSPSVTLTYGLFDQLDLGVGGGYLFFYPKEGQREDGLADTEVKLKYRPLDEKDWRPAIAITGTLKIPTASKSKGLGSNQTDFGINAIITKNLGKRLVLHLNVGYTFIGEDRVENEFNYSMAAQFFITDQWAFVGEIIGINNFNGRKADDSLSGLIGTYYLMTEKLIWDAGIEIGMNKAAPDFRLTTGLTWLFKP